MMIKICNTRFFSSDPERTRIFLWQVFGIKSTCIGEGIVRADVPDEHRYLLLNEKLLNPSNANGSISFYCDDIEQAVKELKAKRVKFKGEIEVRSYGQLASFYMDAAGYKQLFQPK